MTKSSFKRQNVTLRIQRFDPEVDKKPHFDEFIIPYQEGSTILDALTEIKAVQDGSLTFRRSCRHGICGSCAININGQNILACSQQINDHLDRKGRMTIKPLPYLPIIKDLVVDQTVFWEQYLMIKPWLIPPEDIPEKEFRISPAEVAALHNAEKCIMCGACYSACPVIALNKKYIGPHALLKVFERILDPRDSAPGQRLSELDGDNGVYRCHTIFNCIDACPQGLNPTQAIETLRKLAQKRKAYDAMRRERQRKLFEPIPTGAGESTKG
jgi:succinate dehydrogenase / fumarate reductase iron-sulfur subunit